MNADPTNRRVESLLRTPTAIGIRRRPVAFIGLLLLAAGAVVVAVVSPLLLRSAQQSSLAAATPTTLLGAVLTYSSNVPATPDTGQGVVEPSSLWRTAPPLVTTVAALPWRWSPPSGGTGGTAAGHVVASFSCAGLRLSAGRCPVETDEVAVSDASGVPLGGSLRLTSTGIGALRVVGRYTPGNGAPFADPLMTGAARHVDRSRGDDLIVSPPLVPAASPDGAYVTVVGVGAARPFRLEDVAQVRRSLAAARKNLAGLAGGVIATPITEVIAAQQVTSDAASLVALALAAQTLAVAWAAQALFVGGIARSRAGEWGVTRLRGFRAGWRLVAVFAEPVIAVLIGSLAGYLLAAAAAQSVAAGTDASAVQPFEPLPLALGGLAALGSLVALVLASVRSATLPLAQLLRERAEPVRISRVALIAQSGVVLATLLVVYSVLTGGRVTGPQLPLLAPALIAVTAGFVALRIAVPLLRRSLRPLPSTLTGLLVGRRVIRTPSLLAIAVVLCTAVALATAATQTVLSANDVQRRRADAVVGAARVLEVRASTGTDLVAAVRRADPTGRMAMAAIDVDSGGGPQRIVAVDTARLAAVSSWSADWGRTSAARLRRLLAPAGGPSLRLVGQRVEVDLEGSRMMEDPSGVNAVTLPQLELSLTVQNDSGFHRLVLGRLSSSRFTSALPCGSGCRIVGFAVVDRGQIAPWGLTTRIARISTDGQSSAQTAALLRAGLWRQQIDSVPSLDEPPVLGIGAADPGVALTMSTAEGRAIMAVVPRDTPQPVPVLAGPRLSLAPVESIPGAAYGSGLGFESLLVRQVGRAAILPRALGDGVLVDLGIMEKVTAPAAVQGRSQVWLSAAAGPSVVAALQRQGLEVIGQQRLSSVQAGYFDGTVPRVALQGAFVGAVGLLLALLALLVSRLLRRPAMRSTAAALRSAGAPARVVRRIAFTEAALPAAAGVLVGALAGSAGVLLILPSLPLGAGAGLLPPLDYGLSPLAAVVPAAAALVLTVLIAAVTARGVRR